MREYRIKNWNDFNDKVFYNSWDNHIMRYRSNLIFRGVSHAEYDLLPSLNRICGNKVELEKPLLRNFKKYASMEVSDKDNFWEIVSLAQHHGRPTRLLDWTFSPYVAAHFATANIEYNHCDCAIWCLDCIEVHRYLPSSVQKMLKDNMANGFSAQMLKHRIKDFDALKDMEENKKAFPLFFEPSSIDARIVNQYALFSVMSDPGVLISQWLNQYPKLGFKVIIPSDVRMEIRDKLDQINMTERIIYPGLDGLCKWLSRHYTPKERIYREDIVRKRTKRLHQYILNFSAIYKIKLDGVKLHKEIMVRQILSGMVIQYVSESAILGEIRLLINYAIMPFQKLEQAEEEPDKALGNHNVLMGFFNVMEKKRYERIECQYLYEEDIKLEAIDINSLAYWGGKGSKAATYTELCPLAELKVQLRR